jgi:MoxR-like ATPase
MDRFMMKVHVGYPDFEAERSIIDLDLATLKDLRPILNADDLLKIQEMVSGIYMDEKIKKLIVRIIHATRPESKNFHREFEGAILAGASPRGGIWLNRLGKFMAFLEGKDFVSPEHILRVVPAVLGHRIILTYEAVIDKIKNREVASKIAYSLI